MALRRRDLIAAGSAALAWPGLASSGLAWGQAPKKRYALVIGNDGYGGGVGPLRNAVNDSKLVADALRAIGFEIPDDAYLKDASRAKVMAAVRAHAQRLTAAGDDAIGYFYYAGHGAARPDGGNYLIPITDVDPTSLSFWDESVALDWLLTDGLAVPCAQIISIDACRNQLRLPNRDVGGGSFKSVRGLEVSGTGRPTNMFLSFATWEGQTAFDATGQSANGPYAQALVGNLKQPGRVIDLFDDVRLDVLERTQQAQEPMNLSRLSRESRDIVFEKAVTPPQPHPEREHTDSPGPQPPVDDRAGTRGVRRQLNHALVISCTYDGQQAALPNSGTDAAKVAEALSGSGYDITRVVGPDKATMMSKVQGFAEMLKRDGPAAVGVVYFAGHGNSWNGHNYLMPEGRLPQMSDQLPQAGVALEDIIRALDVAHAGAVCLLIDGGRRLGLMAGKMPERGFADDFGTNNVIVAFSTSPGQFAIDTPTGSRFAAALADEMRKPERRYLEQLLAAVRRRILSETGGEMAPSYLSSVQTQIYFRDGAGLISN